jgi:hypothetical protein
LSTEHYVSKTWIDKPSTHKGERAAPGQLTEERGRATPETPSARSREFPSKARRARGRAGAIEKMDRLQRQRTAATLVHQAVEAQTQDHMDHTFAGVMFAVRSGQKLPYEYLEISTVWVRGGLGPISVWSTDGVRQTLERRAPAAPGRAALSASRLCSASASAGKLPWATHASPLRRRLCLCLIPHTARVPPSSPGPRLREAAPRSTDH